MSKLSGAPSPLSATLLASKGAARPTPVFGQRGLNQDQPPLSQDSEAPKSQVSAKADMAEALAHHTSDTQPEEQTQKNTGKKAAFTFRMDESRHFRLRLLSAHQNRSSQKIMEAALDAYLDTHAPHTGGVNCPCFTDAAEF
ncbi:MAG: hypothetical protein AAF562_04755 [Pseudomonadota bacterium]